jgi:hypothetical protein
VVFNRFSKMCILVACNKTMKGYEVANLFFERVWVHLGVPRSIILTYILDFLLHFGFHCGRRWKLN